MDTIHFVPRYQPPHGESWNKGKLSGRKPPLLPKHVWAIRTRLHMLGKKRDLALFNLAVHSKLRGCDLVRLRILDVAPRGYAVDRASIQQRKTCQPVKFEITEQTKLAIDAHLAVPPSIGDRFVFPGKTLGLYLSTRQYARLLNNWLALIGLDTSIFGTHSLRRTKATLIYRKRGNLRAVQLLLGHTKIESTVRYLGIEVDDTLEIAEKVDV
jgi:integrase